MEHLLTLETRSTISTNDGSHPSLSGSYLAAVVLYATITGNDPVGLSHSTSLSNSLVLELQQAGGTVFNETSYLDYPWQTTSPNQNTTTQIQYLAWDSAITFGSGDVDGFQSIVTSSTGETYALGYAQNSFQNGNCVFQHTVVENQYSPFIAKYDANGSCIWILSIIGNEYYVPQTTANTQIGLDSNNSLYAIFGLGAPNSGGETVSLGNVSFYNPASTSTVYLTKITTDGDVDWVTKPNDGQDCH